MYINPDFAALAALAAARIPRRPVESFASTPVITTALNLHGHFMSLADYSNFPSYISPRIYLIVAGKRATTFQ